MDTATPRDAARPTFRDATGDDVPALVALVESAYRGDSSRCLDHGGGHPPGAADR